MTIDHVSLQVPQASFQEILKIYLEALKPLGYETRHQFGPYVVGLGSTKDDSGCHHGAADFWIIGVEGDAPKGSHVAFRTKDRAAVEAFHAAALAAGAKDNGAPGIRANYHPDYYGAFWLDPNGNNVEAVCHQPVVRDD